MRLVVNLNCVVWVNRSKLITQRKCTLHLLRMNTCENTGNPLTSPMAENAWTGHPNNWSERRDTQAEQCRPIWIFLLWTPWWMIRGETFNDDEAQPSIQPPLQCHRVSQHWPISLTYEINLFSFGQQTNRAIQGIIFACFDFLKDVPQCIMPSPHLSRLLKPNAAIERL